MVQLVQVPVPVTEYQVPVQVPSTTSLLKMLIHFNRTVDDCKNVLIQYQTKTQRYQLHERNTQEHNNKQKDGTRHFPSLFTSLFPTSTSEGAL